MFKFVCVQFNNNVDSMFTTYLKNYGETYSRNVATRRSTGDLHMVNNITRIRVLIIQRQTFRGKRFYI